MSNYNESTAEGEITSWQRARQIVLDNPIAGAPGVTIHESKAIRLPDGTTFEPGLGSLSYRMEDPAVTVPLVDPGTFEPTTETFTAGQFALMAASVYMWLARARDESEQL